MRATVSAKQTIAARAVANSSRVKSYGRKPYSTTNVTSRPVFCTRDIYTRLTIVRSAWPSSRFPTCAPNCIQPRVPGGPAASISRACRSMSAPSVCANAHAAPPGLDCLLTSAVVRKLLRGCFACRFGSCILEQKSELEWSVRARSRARSVMSSVRRPGARRRPARSRYMDTLLRKGPPSRSRRLRNALDGLDLAQQVLEPLHLGVEGLAALDARELDGPEHIASFFVLADAARVALQPALDSKRSTRVD